MSVKTGTAINALFTTSNPASGAAINADATPTGVLYLNGSANAAAVTVTNIATGIYKAAVTMPALAAGDTVFLAITATVSGIAGKGVVWGDTGDTAIVSDVKTDSVLLVKGRFNKVISDPVTGHETVYDDNSTTPLKTGDIYEDIAGTMPFDGSGANRRDRMT